MQQYPSRKTLPRAQRVANKAFRTIEQFLHVEAVSGIVLLISAAIALIWANSSAAASYHHLWHLPLSIGLGDHVISQTLHFWINDALMTVFFLVVGMEIRREIHDGALASVPLAALPLAAAMGGVALPAILYLGIAGSEGLHQGWAVPTATDIAFAVGVLALLGKSIPGSVRIFLLTLAIIDDIIAVLIIALFYSGGLEPAGFVLAAISIVLVLGMQQAGIGSAFAYVLPGALLWFGLLQTGAHPTLAGVVLGLMTPVLAAASDEPATDSAQQALREFIARTASGSADAHALMQPVNQLRIAQRELLPPAVRVQMALHPWVAFGVMPLFALANAGVSLDGIDLTRAEPLRVMLAVTVALVIGKPLGIVFSSWIAVRLGWCRVPQGMTWRWLWLVGCLGGIGFTMSIFIANLAFDHAALLAAAKLGVLLASVLAATLGLVVGRIIAMRRSNGQRH